MRGAIVATLAALCLLVPTGSARADTLLDHVNGITLNATGGVERFTGLLLGKDGRITQLLHEGERPATRPDYASDLHGATMIPGLVLPRARLMPLALAVLTQGLPEAKRPAPRPEDRDTALAKLQALLLARGITAVTDLGTSIEDWQTYRRAGDAGWLSIRIAAYAGGLDNMVLIGGPGPTPWLYDGRLRLNGLWIEPASPAAAPPARAGANRPALRPRPATPPAAGTPGPAGQAEIQMKNQMSRAAMDHFQVAVRARDAAAVARVEAAIADLSQTYAGERRWRIEQAPAAESLPLPDPLSALAQTTDRLGLLNAVTAEPARQAYAETRFGRLAPGLAADFVLLDRDPLTSAPGDGRAPRVLSVWVDGRQVTLGAERAVTAESR